MTFDYETTNDAETHFSTMHDVTTLEGQRAVQNLMSEATIRERDACPTCGGTAGSCFYCKAD